MLYKKIHRQYVKEFRKGRKYKFFSVWEVIKEPYIDEGYIKIGINRYGVEDNVDGWCLIPIVGPYKGRMWRIDSIEWID